jgi:hypothetical protein
MSAASLLLLMAVQAGGGQVGGQGGGQVAGPQAGAAVLADTVRVGDVVPVAVRVLVEPGEAALLPDTLGVADDVENAARVRVHSDTLPDGSVQVTGLYTVTPWRTGVTPLPDLTVRFLGPDGETRLAAVPLPALDVVSILPADPDLLQPMPAKGVLGASYPWWLILLVILVLLAAGAAAWRWVARRRARRPALAVPWVPPLDRALAELEDALAAGHVERGEWTAYFTRVAHAVREYMGAVEPGWGVDLTTTEALARVHATAGRAEAAALAEVLRTADQVKFARWAPDAAAATAATDTARSWIERDDARRRPTPLDSEAAA